MLRVDEFEELVYGVFMISWVGYYVKGFCAIY
jgi:hypothetical protein